MEEYIIFSLIDCLTALTGWYLGLLLIVFSNLESRMLIDILCLPSISLIALSNFFLSYLVSTCLWRFYSFFWLISFFSSASLSWACFLSQVYSCTMSFFCRSWIYFSCSTRSYTVNSSLKACASVYLRYCTSLSNTCLSCKSCALCLNRKDLSRCFSNSSRSSTSCYMWVYSNASKSAWLLYTSYFSWLFQFFSKSRICSFLCSSSSFISISFCVKIALRRSLYS